MPWLHPFLAHVQSQNEPLFRRLHWQTLDEVRSTACRTG
jgi:hypothetical protein